MSPNLSRRAQKTTVSSIRNLVQPKNENVRVLGLNIGQPDIESPKEFFDGVQNFNKKVLAYDAAQGNASLIHEWVSLLNTQYNLSLTNDNFLITSGSSEALSFAFNICCDVDDEILVFAPTYVNYTGFASMSGVNLVPIECSFDNKFHIPIERSEIEKHITTKTRAILICNPNNPTGTVFTAPELQTLVSICEAHNLFLLVDEVYREFVYETTPSCILQIASTSENVVVLDSISKRYSLCGARIGCLISRNDNFMLAATNFASTRVSAPTIEQVATAHMLQTLPATYLPSVVAEYKMRRDCLVQALQTIEGVEVHSPEGGFYVFAKLPVDDVEDFSRFLLQEFAVGDETVFISPAHGFFIKNAPPKNYARIAFVLKAPELQRAAHVIEHALIVYKTLNKP